jgi:hypothetical protein
MLSFNGGFVYNAMGACLLTKVFCHRSVGVDFPLPHRGLAAGAGCASNLFSIFHPAMSGKNI